MAERIRGVCVVGVETFPWYLNSNAPGSILRLEPGSRVHANANPHKRHVLVAPDSLTSNLSAQGSLTGTRGNGLLEREVSSIARSHAPQLLSVPGCCITLLRTIERSEQRKYHNFDDRLPPRCVMSSSSRMLSFLILLSGGWGGGGGRTCFHRERDSWLDEEEIGVELWVLRAGKRTFVSSSEQATLSTLDLH